MAVAKVIEIICEGKSIEDALEAGLKEVQKTVQDVKHIDIDHIHCDVKNGKIAYYRVITKVSFVVKS